MADTDLAALANNIKAAIGANNLAAAEQATNDLLTALGCEVGENATEQGDDDPDEDTVTGAAETDTVTGGGDPEPGGGDGATGSGGEPGDPTGGTGATGFAGSGSNL